VLCEYDALPGIGHGCGHNIIAAAGAGAGVALASVIAEVGGGVLVLGTPAEEGGGGKVLMGRRGAFADLDAAMMIHPASLELISMNVLAISAVEVEYHGRAAHAAAAPHAGINALDGLVTAYQAIAQLRQHIRPSERVHGIITDGGQKPNIVPERASGLFYVRAADERRLARLKERVHACFQAGALASGAELHTRANGEDYSDMWTNAALAAAYEANLAALGRRVEHAPPEQISGSTDMGNVSKLVPSIHPMVAIAPRQVALHTAEFATWAAAESGEQGVIDGAKALALTGLDVLCSPDLRAAMRAAFDAEQRTN
jgi:amidohydrolase